MPIKQISTTDYATLLGGRRAASQTTAEADKGAKFEKGKPADPTVNMTDEQKAEWKKQNEANRDKFKSAGWGGGTTSKKEWQKALADDEAMLKKFKADLKTLESGGSVENLSVENARKTIKGLEQVIQNKKKLLSRFAAEESDAEAKFERGEDVPLKDMPEKLQENAKNPPPEVKALKDKMKGEKAAAHQRRAYFTVVLPPGATKWQSPRRTLTRGAFATNREAVAWAKKNVPGEHFTVREIEDVLPIKGASITRTRMTWAPEFRARRASLSDMANVASEKTSASARTYEPIILKLLDKWPRGIEFVDLVDHMIDMDDFKPVEQAVESLKRQRKIRQQGNLLMRVAANEEARTAADKEAKAAGGLYGYTKKVQADCEASTRKLSRKAASLARAAWNKDPRVASFLQTHAKRGKSRSASLLVAALKDIGPKVASDMTAGSGSANVEYLDSLPPRERNMILKVIADHYGVSISEIEDELRDRDAEALYEYIPNRALQSRVYRDFKSMRLASKTARVKSKRDSLGMMRDLEKEHGKHTKAYYQAVLDEVQAGVIAPSAVVGGGYKDGKKVAIKWLKDQMKSAKTATDKEATSYGMYGMPSKVARLGLTACASLKEAAGEISADLHRRRATKHATYTGFLGEHAKTAKCGYSRMLLGFYPDSSAKFASIAPQGVDDWLAWDES